MLLKYKKVFFLGIKGVAMANLAVILKKMGIEVTGCDVEEEFITDRLLKDNGIFWKSGFDKSLIDDKVDLFVFSAAHGGESNGLFKEAVKRGVETISQSKLIGRLMKGYEVKIAVAGCHGKTTTSSLLSFALIRLKEECSYVVGTPYFSGFQGGDYLGKKYFVVEADEYGVDPPRDKTPKFFDLHPDWIICTNIGFDHPDIYHNINETKEVFKKFFEGRNLILNYDDINLRNYPSSNSHRKIIYYGFGDGADYRISNLRTDVKGTKFEVWHGQGSKSKKGDYEISLFGKHNVLNATAVISLLLELGFEEKRIVESIRDFVGARRRFEFIFNKGKITLFDDYAHHPDEIRATISAVRLRFPGKRIAVIFQPHTFSRTKALLKEFFDSLATADFSIILPVFASARESEQKQPFSNAQIKGYKNLFFADSEPVLFGSLGRFLNDELVLFTMGAGDVYKLKDKLIKKISDGK